MYQQSKLGLQPLKTLLKLKKVFTFHTEQIKQLAKKCTGKHHGIQIKLMSQDNLPIQLESRYVNAALMPEFVNQDYSRITATAYLLKQFKPDDMEHRVRAVVPDPDCRELLMLDATQPCLQLTRRTWKDDRVVTWVTLTYPGDRYELGARYATNQYQLR